MPEVFLTAYDLTQIPQSLYPMPVLSDSLRGFFSWGIKVHEQGNYNHFMWLIRPGVLASQGTFFSEEPLRNYLDRYRLKFWMTSWNDKQRATVMAAIYTALGQPWYKRIYDYPAILGQLFWHEFQTPGLSICSDHGCYLKLVDPTYDLRHPDPEQVNHWLVEHPANYQVYGRYVPD